MTRYDFAFYQPGASAPFQVASLGKPSPSADGQIRVSLSTLLLPSPGIVYEGRVIAIGPGGNTSSAASNTFMFAPPCSYGVTPASQAIGAGGWNGWADVSAGAGCSWTAVSNSPWLSVTGGASGSGPGRVSITASENTGTAPRTESLTIAGQSISITQAGVACTFGVSPVSLTVPASGGSPSLPVTASTGCTWTASGGAQWLMITAATGTGTGFVSLSAAANTTTAQRSASLLVAGQPVSVTQNGAAPCSFAVSQTTQSFTAAGGPGTLSVTTGAGCV